MKIGVMTFHWADNYGAALQSYALVRYLTQKGYSAEDIDYVPLRLTLRKKIKNVCLLKTDKLIKSQLFNEFRRDFLKLSQKKYPSNKSLFHGTDIYDAVICGSDQIWNETFCMRAERRPTLSYFLNFSKQPQKKISFAASFGSNKIPASIEQYALCELKTFNAVSVREANAVAMLREHGIEATLVCDPTLLLDAADYEEIVSSFDGHRKVSLFNYMLRQGRESTDKTNEFAKNILFAGKTNLENFRMTPVEWLYQIKSCECVVTDSFHATVFAILFHKPFISINDKACSMNARIKTLLNKLGLEDYMLEVYDEDRIKKILSLDTDWSAVDERKRVWRTEAERFLLDSLGATAK